MREKLLDKIFRKIFRSNITFLYDKNNRKYSLVNSILIDIDNEEIIDYNYKDAKLHQ